MRRADSYRPESTVADVPNIDFAKVNPVTGPVFIDGAEPGDALKVTIHEFRPSGWGWTANIPGFGLLADQFDDPALHIWNYDRASMGPAAYSPIGTCPAEAVCGDHWSGPGGAGQSFGGAAKTDRRQYGHP